MAIESCDRCHVAKTVLVTTSIVLRRIDSRTGREWDTTTTTTLCPSCGGSEEIDRPDVAVARRKR